MPMNYAKTAVLLAVLTALFVALGGLAGGRTGMVIAFIVALGMNMFSLWGSDKVVLRMHDAQEVDENAAPEYYNLVRELAHNAELPMPKVYVLHNPQPNAFATGRSPSHAAVAASTGLLEMMTREEVAGVMAHELAHIKNRDTLTMTVAATIGGAISMLAQFLQFSSLFGRRDQNGGGGGALSIVGTIVAMIVAPMAAGLIQMAISRSREYQADKLGAMICRNPIWLASALHKIEQYVQNIPNEQAERAPGTAHLFIINPLSGRGMDSLFSTHPNTQNRIAALEDLAREWGQSGAAGQGQDYPGAADQGPAAGGPWAGRGGGGGRDGRGPWS